MDRLVVQQHCDETKQWLSSMTSQPTCSHVINVWGCALRTKPYCKHLGTNTCSTHLFRIANRKLKLINFQPTHHHLHRHPQLLGLGFPLAQKVPFHKHASKICEVAFSRVCVCCGIVAAELTYRYPSTPGDLHWGVQRTSQHLAGSAPIEEKTQSMPMKHGDLCVLFRTVQSTLLHSETY